MESGVDPTYLELDSEASIVKVERDDEEEDCTVEDGDIENPTYILPREGEDNHDFHDIPLDPLEESPSPKKKARKTPTTSKSLEEPAPTLIIPSPPKFATKEEFTTQMELSISNIVHECITILQKDPREYHPFYLRVYKFTVVGKQLGWIASENEVDSIWRKYDLFAKTQFELWKADPQSFPQFTGDHSPYLNFIQTKKVIFNGQLIVLYNHRKQRQKVVSEAQSIARQLRKEWLTSGKSDAEAREDLKHRLTYFMKVKHITYPADVIQMNRNWSGFLEGFPKGEWKDVMERLQKKYEETPPPEVKRSGRERKAPARFQPKEVVIITTPVLKEVKPRGRRKKEVMEVKTEAPPVLTEVKPRGRKRKEVTEVKPEVTMEVKEESPPKRKAIEGGQCAECGKVLKSQLARHIREVHRKIKPKRRKSQDSEDDEEENFPLGKNAAGGECPHCHRTFQCQLMYHIWRCHTTTSDGKSRPKRGELKNMTEEQRKAHWAEWARYRRLNMTEEEREEESRKLRERYWRKINAMTPEELEDFRRKNRFHQLQKRLERQNLPEEEKERLKTLSFVRRQAWMARKDRDWREAKKEKVKEAQKKKRAEMTPEEKEEERERHKEYRRNLKGEKLQRYKDSVRRSVKRYFERLKRDKPEEFYNKTTGSQRSKWGALLDYQRERVRNETGEQREARLLRYRINQAKRRVRGEMVGEREEVIDRRLKEVEERIRSEPRKGQGSVYKPRLGARKPHNVPNPRLPPGEMKMGEEEEEVVEENYHPLLQVPAAVPQVEVIPSSSLILAYQPQGTQVAATYQPFTLVETQVEFEAMPSLTLVECVGVPPSSSTHSTTPLDTFEEEGPMSCGSASFQDDEDNSFPESEVPVASGTLETVKPAVPEPVPATAQNILDAVLEAEVKIPVPVPPSRQAAMCDECGKTFTTQFSVQLHKNVMHSLDPSILICPRCQLPCSSTISLWNHFSTYHIQDVDAFPEQYFPKRKRSTLPPRAPSQPYKQLRSDPNHPHVCPTCSKSFVQKCTLDDHIRRLHQGKGHYCSICSKDQQSAAKLWRHKVERHGLSDLPPPPNVPCVTCKFCGETLLRGYEQHVRKRHPEQYPQFSESYIPEKGTAPRRRLAEPVKCPHCPSIVKAKLLNRHIKHIHTNITRIPCPECGFQFKRLDHMRKHYKDHHALADIEKKLEAQNLIKVHTLRSFTATCLLCPGSPEVMSKVVLRAHFVKEHHQIFQECQIASLPIFQCLQCQEKFSKESQLKSHMEAMHPDHLFTCQHCGILKVSQLELDTHEKTHTNADRFKQMKRGLCSLCDFDGRDMLKGEEGEWRGRGGTITAKMKEILVKILGEHVRSEHGDRYFGCPNEGCGRWATSKVDFQNHMARCQKNGMVGSKDFVASKVDPLMVMCPECRKPFRLKQWGKHRKGKHGVVGEEYPCLECKPRVFKCKRYFVAHMHQFHGVPFEDLVELAPEDTKPTRISRGRKVKTEVVEVKRRRPGPKSKTGGVGVEDDGGKKKRGRKPGWRKSGGEEVRMEVEREKRLVISVERIADDLVRYYLARQIIVKSEPET